MSSLLVSPEPLVLAVAVAVDVARDLASGQLERLLRRRRRRGRRATRHLWSRHRCVELTSVGDSSVDYCIRDRIVDRYMYEVCIRGGLVRESGVRGKMCGGRETRATRRVKPTCCG